MRAIIKWRPTLSGKFEVSFAVKTDNQNNDDLFNQCNLTGLLMITKGRPLGSVKVSEILFALLQSANEDQSIGDAVKNMRMPPAYEISLNFFNGPMPSSCEEFYSNPEIR
jgi:hypothetical protein